MLKKTLLLTLALVLLAGFASVYAENNKEEVSAADKDGFILYSLCSADANLMLMTGDTADETIAIVKQGSSVKFVYREHVLSCGTHMNGTITQTKKDGKLLIQGDFDTAHNPYGIAKLLVNLVKDPSTQALTGTLTIDGRERDVNLLR